MAHHTTLAQRPHPEPSSVLVVASNNTHAGHTTGRTVRQGAADLWPARAGSRFASRDDRVQWHQLRKAGAVPQGQNHWFGQEQTRYLGQVRCTGESVIVTLSASAVRHLFSVDEFVQLHRYHIPQHLPFVLRIPAILRCNHTQQSPNNHSRTTTRTDICSNGRRG